MAECKPFPILHRNCVVGCLFYIIDRVDTWKDRKELHWKVGVEIQLTQDVIGLGGLDNLVADDLNCVEVSCYYHPQSLGFLWIVANDRACVWFVEKPADFAHGV